MQPFQEIMQLFQEIIQPFRGIIQPFEVTRISIERLCIIQYVCCQRTTQAIPPRLYHSSSYGELTLLVEQKQKKRRIMIMENTSREPIPGHYGTSIVFANTRSERKSLQCLDLRPGHVSVKFLHIGKETDNHHI